jgi:hypothetical protein
MRVKLVLLDLVEVVIHVVLNGAVIMPEVQPIERVGKERSSCMNGRGHFGCSAHDLPGCRYKTGSGLLRALACRRLRIGSAPRQLRCNVAEFPFQPFGEAGHFAQMIGTWVFALGFPIPSASIGLARLAP